MAESDSLIGQTVSHYRIKAEYTKPSMYSCTRISAT